MPHSQQTLTSRQQSNRKAPPAISLFFTGTNQGSAKAFRAFLIGVTALGLITLNVPAHAADAKAGKTLHDRGCLGCHGVEVYRQKRLSLKSKAQLQTHIANNCNPALRQPLTDKELAQVVEYLNASYYRF